MIYLDHAATGFPKPRRVTEEQARCMRAYCGNPGRGSHAMALAAAEKIYECRTLAKELFLAPSPEQVVFTMNATMAINTVIKGTLRRGDHVLISDMEHNAVWRPIWRLASRGLITYDVFPTYPNRKDRTAEEICQAIRERITPRTKMLICAHASNISSATLPIEAIGTLCRRHGILFAVDAAQSAGHIPIDVGKMKIDALCLPGHKGLLGPQGTGMLILGERILPETLIEGGSGVHSLDGAMPEDAPERYEAGTLPTPAIAGLCEGLRTLMQMGVETVGEHDRAWSAYLQERLLENPRVKIYTPHFCGSVLLFNIDGIPADRVGMELDHRGICVRAGYHCAALAHTTIGTGEGGAVRVSPGYRTPFSHADALVRAVEEICNA